MIPKLKLVKPGVNQIRNNQMFYGGIPLNQHAPTIIKPIEEEEQQSRKPMKKKFSTDSFLDLYLAEKNKKVTTF